MLLSFPITGVGEAIVTWTRRRGLAFSGRTRPLWGRRPMTQCFDGWQCHTPTAIWPWRRPTEAPATVMISLGDRALSTEPAGNQWLAVSIGRWWTGGPLKSLLSFFRGSKCYWASLAWTLPCDLIQIHSTSPSSRHKELVGLWTNPLFVILACRYEWLQLPAHQLLWAVHLPGLWQVSPWKWTRSWVGEQPWGSAVLHWTSETWTDKYK